MDDVIRPMAETRAASGGIPLELGPLLSPYGQYKHLSLRIERLPDRARLSKGRNNADHTWSLTPEELDGLTYFPPNGMTKAHTIALRIINLDGEYGATLAMLDYPIEPKNALPAQAGAIPDTAVDPAYRAELSRLRDELVAAQSKLAQRDAELTDTRQKLDHANTEGLQQKIAAEVTAARAAWQTELEKRLANAATQAAAKLEQSRAAWQVEQQARLAKTDALAKEGVAEARRRSQQEAEAALAKAQASWQAGEAQRLAAADAKWREQSAQPLAAATARAQEAETALAQARAETEALRNRGEDPELARLRNELGAAQAALTERDAAMKQARAETEALRNRGEDPELARLRNELGATQAALTEREAAMQQARAEAEALRKRGEDPELAPLRDQLAAAQAALSERDGALAQARSPAEQAGPQAMAQAQVALNKAAAAWKANEAKRLAEAEAHWREQSAQALAEATTRAERAESDLAKLRAQAEPGSPEAIAAELGRLRDDLASVQAVLSQREIELVEARQRGGPINTAELRQAVEAELAAARSAWDLELEKRLSDAAMQAQADLEKSRAAWEVEQQKSGAASEGNAQAQIQQALQAAQQQTNLALAKAAESWRAAEASRLAEAEAKWRQQSEQAFAEAGARAERAEAALAAARTQAAQRDQGDNTELLRLRGELAALQATLAEREAALIQAREAAEQARASVTAEAQTASRKAEESRAAEKPLPPIVVPAEPRNEAPRSTVRGGFAKAIGRQRRAQLMRYAVRGGALAASLVVAMFAYPYARAMIAGVPAEVAAVRVAVVAAAEPYFAQPDEPPPPPPQPEPVAAADEPRWVIAASTATVRAGPSPAAGLVATLPRDIEVSPVEHRGNWVLIRFGGENGNHVREGWITRSTLKEATER